MRKTFALIFICFFTFSNALAFELEDFFNLIKNQNYIEAGSYVSELEESEQKKLLNTLHGLYITQTSESLPIEILDTDTDETKFIKYLILGYQNTYAKKPDNLKAFIHFSDALKISEIIKNKDLSKAALIAILNLFSKEIFIGSKQYKPYLDQFIELEADQADSALIIIYNLIFFTKGDYEMDNIDSQYYNYYEKLDSIFKKIPKSHNFYTKYFFEKGIFYKVEQDYEKSEDFFIKADSIAALYPHMKTTRTAIAWQLASINWENNQLEKAKNYLKISKKGSKKLKDRFYNDRLSSLIFYKENNFDSAYHYLRKSVDVEYQLGYKNNTLESSILSVQNQTDKLKLDKLELDAENRKTRNWVAGLAVLLLLGASIAFLINSNTRRKQLLAEQQQKLQEQKVATLLKEQELATIDAMIEGQEKERQRIANDLHDDLGGLMATVKLHFNSLNSKVKDDTDDLYVKTNNLIDEAYQKIRAIAHAKNSGVIAKQGLLKAVEQMGEKVSIANSIAIEVKDFGLDNRLENSLELTLFRIIQELIANIIKHADASKVNIHLTNHGDTLNILVEDNGVGFKATKIVTSSTGIGLKSIDQRVAHLNGSFDIESEPGQGTTVIIDIPL